jgi:hypothetical protein
MYDAGILKVSKAEFDGLVAEAEERLGKDVVAAVKRAHRNGRYRNDWAPTPQGAGVDHPMSARHDPHLSDGSAIAFRSAGDAPGRVSRKGR